MQQEYHYTPLPEPIPISEQEWTEGTLPLVCTSTLAYNHEPYIRDCLEGILMQKTTFPVQVLIHEDCSTDKTIEILKEYETKYPNLIKVYYQPENIYRMPAEEQQKRRAEFLSWEIGKYTAICEGDDYWIDPLKLQKQVDFLEENEEYSMCFTNAELKGEYGKQTQIYSHLQDKDYTKCEILKKWSVPTASVLHKNFAIYNEFPPVVDNRFMYGDIILFMWLATKGKIRCINQKTVVYRRNKGGVTNIKKSHTIRINHYLAIQEHYGCDNITKKLIAKVYVGSFISGKLGKESFRILREVSITKYFLLFMYYLPGIFLKSLYNKLV